MIDIEVAPTLFQKPWAESFEARYSQFLRGRWKVAYYYAKPDYSTFRYRAYNMICAISSAETDISASHFTSSDMPMIDKVLGEADVLVLCRARYDHHVARLIALARRRGCIVVYDVDDLVFDIDQVPLLVNTVGVGFQSAANWDYWFGYVASIATTIPYCDKVIVTTSPLSKLVQSRFDKPTEILPNFLNQEQLDISHRIYSAKESNGFRSDGTVHLGYFSGSPTHKHDYELVCAALRELLDEFPQIRLRIVGYLDFPATLRSHVSRIEMLPIQDFVNLQRTIGSTEINLVPLQNNVFTNCKSELKYFEAAIVGTVTIASPTLPFRHAIKHGVNGLLARPPEWEEMIRLVLGDSKLYRSIARQAHIAARERHSWMSQLPAITAALSAA